MTFNHYDLQRSVSTLASACEKLVLRMLNVQKLSLVEAPAMPTSGHNGQERHRSNGKLDLGEARSCGGNVLSLIDGGKSDADQARGNPEHGRCVGSDARSAINGGWSALATLAQASHGYAKKEKAINEARQALYDLIAALGNAEEKARALEERFPRR